MKIFVLALNHEDYRDFCFGFRGTFEIHRINYFKSLEGFENPTVYMTESVRKIHPEVCKKLEAFLKTKIRGESKVYW